jgi:hypothetical protein
MGAIATILPLVLEALKLAPTLVSTGQQVYDGAKAIWDGVSAQEVPTPEQQAQVDAALAESHAALMADSSDQA